MLFKAAALGYNLLRQERCPTKVRMSVRMCTHVHVSHIQVLLAHIGPSFDETTTEEIALDWAHTFKVHNVYTQCLCEASVCSICTQHEFGHQLENVEEYLNQAGQDEKILVKLCDWADLVWCEIAIHPECSRLCID